MTNTEVKTVLAKAGVAEADIEKVQGKFDAEKITEIVEAASNPKEAMENLHAFYPELEVSKLEEQMNFVQDQLEAAYNGNNANETVELTEKELEMVSGGGFGDWFKKNWKEILGVAVIAVGFAVTVACAPAALAGSGLALIGSLGGGVAMVAGAGLFAEGIGDKNGK